MADDTNRPSDQRGAPADDPRRRSERYRDEYEQARNRNVQRSGPRLPGSARPGGVSGSGACHCCVSKNKAHKCNYNHGAVRPCNECEGQTNKHGYPLVCNPVGAARPGDLADSLRIPRGPRADGSARASGRGRGREGARSEASHRRSDYGGSSSNSLRPSLTYSYPSHLPIPTTSVTLQDHHQALDHQAQLHQKEVDHMTRLHQQEIYHMTRLHQQDLERLQRQSLEGRQRLDAMLTGHRADANAMPDIQRREDPTQLQPQHDQTSHGSEYHPAPELRRLDPYSVDQNIPSRDTLLGGQSGGRPFSGPFGENFSAPRSNTMPLNGDRMHQHHRLTPNRLKREIEEACDNLQPPKIPRTTTGERGGSAPRSARARDDRGGPYHADTANLSQPEIPQELYRSQPWTHRGRANFLSDRRFLGVAQEDTGNSSSAEDEGSIPGGKKKEGEHSKDDRSS